MTDTDVPADSVCGNFTVSAAADVIFSLSCRPARFAVVGVKFVMKPSRRSAEPDKGVAVFRKLQSAAAGGGGEINAPQGR